MIEGYQVGSKCVHQNENSLIRRTNCGNYLKIGQFVFTYKQIEYLFKVLRNTLLKEKVNICLSVAELYYKLPISNDD